MKLADGETSIACYPEAAPRGRGIQATLTSHRLVWSDDADEEHFPLNQVSSVTYGFKRATRRLVWSVILLGFAALLCAGLLWTQANLPALAESMVKTLADGENPEQIAAARRAYQQRLDLLMLLVLPLWGVVGVIVMHAAWLSYTGIRGESRVQFSMPSITRSLQQRGRDTKLLAFGETAAQRAAGLEATTKTAGAEGNFDNWVLETKSRPQHRKEPEI